MHETSQAEQIAKELLRDVHVRLFEEGIPRIKKCIDQLTTDQIWWRPNENSNSIGNLILHLNGNVRQWILSGLCGGVDIRQRQLEFDQRELVGHALLHHILVELEADVRKALSSVSMDALIDTHPVQIYQETGISILVHVTEHFSYHTGQIAWITKMLVDDQLSFYGDIDLG